ncbi:MAG: response regulator transcription factor [Myxococcota bacterium]
MTTESPRLLLVDDHPVFRLGLKSMLEMDGFLQVVAEAASASEARAELEGQAIDLMLLDISLPEETGLELLRSMREGTGDGPPVLVLSMHDERVYAERALRAGARGYLMKHEAPDRVLDFVHRVLAGEVAVSERVQRTMLDRIASGERADAAPPEVLTARELEVFELIGHGLRSKEIAERLGISARTVETHRTHMRRKLGLDGSSDLLRVAMRYAAGLGTGD